MDLGVLAPILARAAGPVVHAALGSPVEGDAAPSPLVDSIQQSVELRAELAQSAMLDPGFGKPDPFDWQRAALVVAVGLVLGHVAGKLLR